MRKQPSAEYRGYRTGGIRMSEDLAPELAHGREADERAALYATHAYDKAHAVMLIEQRIVPREVGVALLRGLRQMEAEPGGAVEARARTGGGMHSGELYLIRHCGEEIGGWDHTGRSSACLAVVGRRILQRDGLLDSLEALNVFRRALLELAGDHLDAVMPGYFRSQLVQPMSFGHYLLGVAHGLERDAARARDCYQRSNLNPGGGVVLTGTAFAIDRERVAELLGFDGVVVNAADAIQGNDTTLECFAFLAILAMQLTKLTADFDRWVATENRFLDVADRYGAGSSLAMNMKTPMFPGQGLVNNIVGDLVKAFAPLGTLGAISAEGDLQAMSKVLKLYANVLATVRFDRPRALEMARTLDHGGGTDLAGLLVTERGLSWRTAHQICGILFRHCSERNIAAAQITGELLDEAAVEYFDQPLRLSTEAIQQAMDPVRIVASRTHTGGSAPLEARRQLQQLTAGVEADERWLRERRERLTSAGTELERAIDAIVSG